MPGPVYMGTAMVFSCSWCQYFFSENINFLNFCKNINFIIYSLIFSIRSIPSIPSILMPGPVYMGTAMVFSCSWCQYFFSENINFLNFCKNINFINILDPFDPFDLDAWACLYGYSYDVFLLLVSVFLFRKY